MRFFGTCVLLVLLMAGTAMGRGAVLATSVAKFSGVNLDTLPPFHRAFILHKLDLEFALMSKPMEISSLLKQSPWYSTVRGESRLERREDRLLMVVENLATTADKDLAVYFPNLSRLAVNDLLRRKEEFGNHKWLSGSAVVKDSLATQALIDVALLMGDTGRRDILEKLNSFEPDVVKNVVREVNRKWNLSLVDSGVLLEVTAVGETNKLERHFDALIAAYRQRINNTRKGYLPITERDYPQTVAKLDKDMERLQEVADMPYGTDRNTAMAELIADLNTDEHFGAFFYNEIVEERVQGSILMKFLLEDITHFTIAAVHQLSDLHNVFALDRQHYDNEVIRNLLDAELQIALTNRSYPYQGSTLVERY